MPQPTPDPSSGESPLSLSTGRLQLPCVRRSADSPFQNRPCNGKGFAQGHEHSRHPPIPERKLLPSFDQSFAFPRQFARRVQPKLSACSEHRTVVLYLPPAGSQLGLGRVVFPPINR